jgi:hypothetical protein
MIAQHTDVRPFDSEFLMDDFLVRDQRLAQGATIRAVAVAACVSSACPR